MTRSIQITVLLAALTLFIHPAFGTSSGKPDHQPCPSAAKNFDSAVKKPQQGCPSPASGQLPSKSPHVVHASELRSQYRDLNLTSEELRSLISNAKTPEDHLRLARYYGLRADADLAQASEHQKIALSWSANSLGSSSKYIIGTVNHCLAIVHRFKQHAAQMRKLQAEQEQLALLAAE